MVPIVSTSMEKGNACQQTPEHGNKMYERGGDLHISAAIHYWEQGSVFQDSDKISRYLTSVGARGPPCLSRTVKRGSNIEDRESRSGKRGSRILDRGSRIENREWRIENRESGIEKRGSRIENGLVKPGLEN